MLNVFELRFFSQMGLFIGVNADLLHITGMGQGPVGISFSPTEPPYSKTTSQSAVGSDILDRTTHELKLEKSNILLLGPTGSG